MAVGNRDIRAMIHPGIRVRSGPFESTIGAMVRFGWEFDMMDDGYRSNTILLLAKNTTNGCVFRSTFNREYIREHYIESCFYFYFPQDLVLEASFFNEIHMPRIGLISAVPGVIHNDRFHKPVIMKYEAELEERDQTKSVIVMPEDVGSMLDQILAAQKPRQQELIRDKLKSEEIKGMQVKAKILTFNQ